MTWSEHHTISERLADEALTAARAGDSERARELYMQAAIAELAALRSLPVDKIRTFGITAVSAVALYYKARAYEQSERLSHEVLGLEQIPQFARNQIQHLLQVIWTTRAADRSGIRFLPGDVLVSVKGGEITYGGAPLDLIVSKVTEVHAVFQRVVEMLIGREFRTRGAAPRDVQEMCVPWLFQVPAGSYQFAVRVQEPPQMEIFDEARPKVEQVTTKFMEVIRATAGSPGDALEAVVPDEKYRQGFLRLARNLAPTGKRFDSLEIRDASTPAGRAISLAKEARRDINRQIRETAKQTNVMATGEIIQIRGRLRGVHLDNDWLDVTVGDSEQSLRVYEANEVLDDVVGPMVNRPVVVSVVITSTGRHEYRDIELDE